MASSSSSQPSAPNIPERSSSRVQHEEKELKHKESTAELKRKLSSISVENDPITYRKLRILELEFSIDGEKLEKTRLDLEREEDKIFHKDYMKSHRQVNIRIVSLGDELWKENRALRSQEEQMGKVPLLGPDSQGAFIQTLLRLYKDPFEHSKRSSSIQTQMKDESIVTYAPDKGAPAGKLFCSVSRGYYDKPDVRAGHIVPRVIGPEVMDYLFGSGSGSRLDSPDNCLFMHTTVEKAFDLGHFVLLPCDASEFPIRRWRVQVTNTSAINKDFGRQSLKDYDGKEIEFKNNNRPASRFLYYHFVVTLLRNKKFRTPGWEACLTELPKKKPFATPGKYLRSSMLLQLARMAGDWDLDAETNELGKDGQELFTEQEKLGETAEAEVARRVFVAHDQKESDQNEEELPES